MPSGWLLLPNSGYLQGVAWVHRLHYFTAIYAWCMQSKPPVDMMSVVQGACQWRCCNGQVQGGCQRPQPWAH